MTDVAHQPKHTSKDTHSAEESPARFRDLLAAEWIKLKSLRSTYWVLGGGALAVIGINVQATLALYRLVPSWSDERKDTYNWMNDALGQTPFLLLMLAAATIGALSMTGEYHSGMIRTTFAAVPARRSVVLAKVVVISAVMLVLGIVIATASVGLTQAILSGRDAGFSIDDDGVPTAVVASALIVPVCALIGIGVGVVIKHTAASIIGVFTVLIILPQLTSGTTYSWVIDINNAMPWSAWMTLRNTPIRDYMPAEAFPWAVTSSWLVFVVWPLVAIILAVAVSHRRDV